MVGLSSKEWELLRAWLINHRDAIHKANWSIQETTIAIRKNVQALYIITPLHVREMQKYVGVRFRDDPPPATDACVLVSPTKPTAPYKIGVDTGSPSFSVTISS